MKSGRTGFAGVPNRFFTSGQSALRVKTKSGAASFIGLQKFCNRDDSSGHGLELPRDLCPAVNRSRWKGIFGPPRTLMFAGARRMRKKAVGIIGWVSVIGYFAVCALIWFIH